MQYFTREYIDFFLELEQNNQKEWFHANKKRYDVHVRKPMVRFTADLIQELQKYDSEISAVPAKCLGRINRDIRFSKDKTPYNQHLFAHIIKGDKSNPSPVIAYRFGGRDGGIMSGYFMPNKSQLSHIRNRISSELAAFQALKTDPKFIAKFGGIRGEKYKRLPAELTKIQEEEPLIANKQLYYVVEKDAEFVTSDQLLEEVVEHWLVAKPLNDFFA